MNNQPLGPKDPDEIKVLSFSFERDLAGASIAAVLSCTVAAHKGVDAGASSCLLGAPVASGDLVLVRMQSGLDGVIYKWRVKVSDSAGNVHVATALVAVKTL